MTDKAQTDYIEDEVSDVSDSERTERRLFTYDERVAILKSTGGKCACCGCKLTTRTLTVEHIIPISRGGTNDMENLTALCETCNKDKSNLLYLPRSFYMALIGTTTVRQMDDMVRQWFKENPERIDIEKHPLIAPKHNCMYCPTKMTSKHKPPYNRQLIVTWSQLYTPDDYDEIEAITSTDLKSIRILLERTRDDIDEYNKPKNKTHQEIYKPLAFYVLRKLSTGKVLAVAAIRYDEIKRDLLVYLAWTDMTKNALPMVLDNLLGCASDAIENIAEKSIDRIAILTPYDHAFDYFRMGYTFYYRHWHRADVETYLDTISNSHLHVLYLYPSSSYTEDVKTGDYEHQSFSQYINVPKWLKLLTTDEI